MDEDFPTDLLPEGTGLIIADAYDAEIIRMAPEDKLPPARRKVMVQKFARHAALRWHPRLMFATRGSAFPALSGLGANRPVARAAAALISSAISSARPQARNPSGFTSTPSPST